jgi:hypothetical protein
MSGSLRSGLFPRNRPRRRHGPGIIHEFRSRVLISSRHKRVNQFTHFAFFHILVLEIGQTANTGIVPKLKEFAMTLAVGLIVVKVGRSNTPQNLKATVVLGELFVAGRNISRSRGLECFRGKNQVATRNWFHMQRSRPTMTLQRFHKGHHVPSFWAITVRFSDGLKRRADSGGICHVCRWLDGEFDVEKETAEERLPDEEWSAAA